jgi:hypothetical protein
LILAAPSSPAKLGSVLRSPWGRGKRRKSIGVWEINLLLKR